MGLLAKDFIILIRINGYLTREKQMTYKNITIYGIVIFISLLASNLVRAEARTPQLVIAGFIEALHNNDMAYLIRYVHLEQLKNQPKHAYTVEQLRILFSDVEVSKINYSKPVHDKENNMIRIKMNAPLAFDFELQHQNNDGKNKGDFYRIINLHP
jgi:hypothetical protein